MGSHLEEIFLQDLKNEGLPTPKREHQFFSKRLWKLDFYWEAAHPVAFEIEGGTGENSKKPSRHTTPAGFTEDCRKYFEAQMIGIAVYRVSTDMVISGEAVSMVARALVRHDGRYKHRETKWDRKQRRLRGAAGRS